MYRRVACVVLACLFVAAACGDDDDDADASPSGDESSESITIALEGEPTTLDVHFTLDGQMRRVAENIYERLIDRDLNDPSQLVPRLATELPTRVDDTHWEVKLREGVEFTNGEPFNAESAAASINRIVDPEFDSDILSQVVTIESAEAVDDTTLRITTTGPDPILPARLYMIQMAPKDYLEDESFTREPVGTGPYEFVEWVSGDHIDLVRNDDYWGDAPEIEEVRFRFLAENQARVAALQSGDVHLATGIVPESVGDVPQAITRDGAEFPFIRVKNYEGPLEDVRVRQAIAYAVNVPEYIETIYQGQASQAQCQINQPAVFGFNPDLEPYPHDPDQARQLLADAGYDGEEIRITVPSDRWPKYEELAEAIDQDLEEVGLNVNMEIMLFDPWIEEYLRGIGEGQPDGALSATANDLLDMDKLSSNIGGSAAAFTDPEIEAMLDEARVELDEDRRFELYQEITEAACEQVAYVALLTFKDIYGASEALEWTPRPDGTARVEEMSLG